MHRNNTALVSEKKIYNLYTFRFNHQYASEGFKKSNYITYYIKKNIYL